MWVLILHLFFPYKTKIMVYSLHTFFPQDWLPVKLCAVDSFFKSAIEVRFVLALSRFIFPSQATFDKCLRYTVVDIFRFKGHWRGYFLWIPSFHCSHT